MCDDSMEQVRVPCQPTGFNNLPLELREKIYGYIISNRSPATCVLPIRKDSCYMPNNSRKSHLIDRDQNILRFTYLKGHLPASLFLNCQILQEASIVSLRTTKLHIPGDRQALSPLYAFLASFPGTCGYDSVRHLSFTFRATRAAAPSTIATDASARFLDPHQLIFMCPGLIEVKILEYASSPGLTWTPGCMALHGTRPTCVSTAGRSSKRSLGKEMSAVSR
jgi:hypothetical protein